MTDATSAPHDPRSGLVLDDTHQHAFSADICDLEERSIAFADADGWRCFYPATRGHLTAAEARAELRAARGLPPETPGEREAAEFVLVTQSVWFDGESAV